MDGGGWTGGRIGHFLMDHSTVCVHKVAPWSGMVAFWAHAVAFSHGGRGGGRGWGTRQFTSDPALPQICLFFVLLDFISRIFNQWLKTS